MFALKIAKAQTKAPDSPIRKPAPQPSKLVARSLDFSAVEQARMLQRTIGNQATPRYPTQRLSDPLANGAAERRVREGPLENMTARETPRSSPWDFSKIPAFSPDRLNRPQARSSLGAPRLPGAIQPKLGIGEVDDPLEHEANRVADQVMRMPAPVQTDGGITQPRSCTACDETEQTGTLHAKQDYVRRSSGAEAPTIVDEVLRSAGEPLDTPTRAFFEPRFGQDFSRVRVHADNHAAESAHSVGALAYTVGPHIAFARGRYAPASHTGQALLAHELVHVMQQQSSMPQPPVASSMLQRRVSVRDVGRGEQSGMGRLDEFVGRLNEVSTGLTFRVESGWLLAEPRGTRTLSEFDRQMQAFVADPADIPMRMTNRSGLLGDRVHGFHTPVELDAWESGYVDIDDFLASSPTDFMTSLVHLLRERQQTRNYARRIGSPSLDLSDPRAGAEFNRAHGAGLDAELAILRDYLQDPSVRFIDRDTRLLSNKRGDRIEERLSAGGGGLNAGRWVVVLHDTRRVISLEEYRDVLETERTSEQIRRERSQGAADYRSPGGGVPAP